MKTFLKSAVVIIAIILGFSSQSNAQMIDACNRTACDLRIIVEFEPSCAAANGCATMIFSIPAGVCPMAFATGCPCPVISYTVTDGVNSYTVGEPAFGYPGWHMPGAILCGKPHDIIGGPGHIHVF